MIHYLVRKRAIKKKRQEQQKEPKPTKQKTLTKPHKKPKQNQNKNFIGLEETFAFSFKFLSTHLIRWWKFNVICEQDVQIKYANYTTLKLKRFTIVGDGEVFKLFLIIHKAKFSPLPLSHSSKELFFLWRDCQNSLRSNALWSALNRKELQTIFTFSFSDILHANFCSPLSSCVAKGVKEVPSFLSVWFCFKSLKCKQKLKSIYFEVNAKIYLFKTGRSP